MADRKKYFAEYYQKNKEKMDAQTYRWIDEYKRKHGETQYATWKRNQNRKYTKKVLSDKIEVHKLKAGYIIEIPKREWKNMDTRDYQIALLNSIVKIVSTRISVFIIKQ